MNLKHTTRRASRCILPIASAAALLLFLPARPARASFDFDNQLWLRASLDAGLSKRLGIYADEELRIGNEVSEAAYFHAEMGMKFAVHKLLGAGLFYRQVFAHRTWYYDLEQNRKKAWDAEFQPGFFFQLTLTPGRVVFQEKLRFEIPAYENNRQTGFKLKHITLVGVKFPKDHPKSVLAYIRNIQIFDLHPERLYKLNRVFVGIVFPAHRVLDLDVYYMWQRSERGGEFYDFFVLGLGARVKVRRL